jgi:DNA-binding MarR family transcriptional regulator
MAKPDPERMAAWTALRTVHDRIRQQLESTMLVERGLPLAWCDVLEALRVARGRLAATELARQVRIAPSTLTRQLDRLEEAELICRSRSLDDARIVIVAITPEGRDVLRKATTTATRVVTRAVRPAFSDADATALKAIVARLVE